MKTTALLALVLGFALAGYNPLMVGDPAEILKQLTEGNHNHYVLLFYMPAEQTSHLGYRNEKMLQEVKEIFLEPNDVESVFFKTINVAEEGYGELIDRIGLDVNVLSDGPVTMIMEHGNGYLIRGPRSASSIQQYLDELQANKEKGWR